MCPGGFAFVGRVGVRGELLKESCGVLGVLGNGSRWRLKSLGRDVRSRASVSEVAEFLKRKKELRFCLNSLPISDLGKLGN